MMMAITTHFQRAVIFRTAFYLEGAERVVIGSVKLPVLFSLTPLICSFIQWTTPNLFLVSLIHHAGDVCSLTLSSHLSLSPWVHKSAVTSGWRNNSHLQPDTGVYLCVLSRPVAVWLLSGPHACSRVWSMQPDCLYFWHTLIGKQSQTQICSTTEKDPSKYLFLVSRVCRTWPQGQ